MVFIKSFHQFSTNRLLTPRTLEISSKPGLKVDSLRIDGISRSTRYERGNEESKIILYCEGMGEEAAIGQLYTVLPRPDDRASENLIVVSRRIQHNRFFMDCREARSLIVRMQYTMSVVHVFTN